MTNILSVANQKGGVGKTTTAVNTSAVLSGSGKKVLLVDLDPQANATMGSGIDKHKLENSIYELLIGTEEVKSVLKKTRFGYDLLPSNKDLIGAELDLVDANDREYRLSEQINKLAFQYDFIIIDCPPSLSLLTLNGLCASSGILIPMQCEYFALEGLSDLVNSVKLVHANLNSKLSSIGLLRVMFDPRVTLSQDVSAQLLEHFGRKVFSTIIPKNVRLAEAPSHGLPITHYDKSSRGSLAYQEFGKELLNRFST